MKGVVRDSVMGTMIGRVGRSVVGRERIGSIVFHVEFNAMRNDTLS